MTRMAERVGATAALLVGLAGLPAGAMVTTRGSQSAQVDEEFSKPGWALLGVACVTLVSAIVYRRAKARPKAQR